MKQKTMAICITNMFAAMLLVCFTQVNIAEEIADETRLHVDLSKKTYVPDARPLKNHKDIVYVSVHLYIVSLDLNIRQQSMTSLIWLEQRWKDEFMTWDPADYNGVDRIFVDANKIWKPDVVIRNRVGSKLQLWDYGFNTGVVNSSGHVLFWPGTEVGTACDINAAIYPFDIQNCSIDVGKWYSDDNIVQIYPEHTDVNMVHFEESEEWTVIGNDVQVITKIEDGYNNSQIIYSVKLKRRSLFSVFNLILPLLFLSLLNNVCFLLPIECGEKIGTCMAMFLTFAVLQTLVNESLPQSSIHIPVYELYLLSQNFLSGLAIALEALVTHVYHYRPQNKTVESKILIYVSKLIGIPTHSYVFRLRNTKECEAKHCILDVCFQKDHTSRFIDDGQRDQNCEEDEIEIENAKKKDHGKDLNGFANMLPQSSDGVGHDILWTSTAEQLDRLFGRLFFVLNITAFFSFVCYVNLSN